MDFFQNIGNNIGGGLTTAATNTRDFFVPQQSRPTPTRQPTTVIQSNIPYYAVDPLYDVTIRQPQVAIFETPIITTPQEQPITETKTIPPTTNTTNTTIHQNYFTTQSTGGLTRADLDPINADLLNFETKTNRNFKTVQDSLTKVQSDLSTGLSQNAADLNTLKLDFSNINTQISKQGTSIFSILTNQKAFEEFTQNQFTQIKSDYSKDFQNLANNIKTTEQALRTTFQDENKQIVSQIQDTRNLIDRSNTQLLNVINTNQSFLIETINRNRQPMSYFEGSGGSNIDYDIMFRK